MKLLEGEKILKIFNGNFLFYLALTFIAMCSSSGKLHIEVNPLTAIPFLVSFLLTGAIFAGVAMIATLVGMVLAREFSPASESPESAPSADAKSAMLWGGIIGSAIFPLFVFFGLQLPTFAQAAVSYFILRDLLDTPAETSQEKK